MFASQTQETRPVPFDPPQTVTIRKLTGAEVEDAQVQAIRGMVGGRTGRGFARHIQRLLQGTATEPDAAQAATDPLAGFDRLVVVRGGLLAWTYPQPLTAVTDLDDEALDFLAGAILRLTKPALFQTEAERDEARKNG
jgi:hypothetical protein